VAETDLDTIKNLEKLWQKITEGITKASEGVTKADETLKQVREVQGEISSALDNKLEVEQLLRDAQKQVRRIQKLSANVEIRIKDLERMEEEVKSAVDEVGDPEILATLNQDIQNARRDLVESKTQLQEIRREVEAARGNVSGITIKNEAILQEVRQVKLEIGELREDVVSVIKEVGGREGLERLRQEYYNVSDRLSQITDRFNQNAQEKFQILQNEASRIEETQKITKQQLAESQELIAKIQSKLVEQAMSEVEKVVQGVQVQEAQVLDQLASLGETIRQQELLKLKLENMEKEQQRQSKLLKRGIWGILVVLGMIAILIGVVVGKLIVLLE
jgi:chromosome segregation ATPase